MRPAITFNIRTQLFTRLLYGLAVLALLAILVFCGFYISTGYKSLLPWYVTLDTCFYRSRYFTSFFTPGIKSDGNMYCRIAIGCTLFLLWHLVRRYRSRPPGRTEVIPVSFSFSGSLPVLACVIAGITAWRWGNAQALPAFDEVFSAQNSAGVHPFVAMSYYMLPNNHIFFNLVNDLLFHAASNKVVTGRLISLTAYLGFILVLYAWLRQQFDYRWLACITAIMLSLQFFVWVLGFQARSYELCLLAEVGAFISVVSYMRSGKASWLNANAVCCVVGYFCVPSFLYFHVALLLFMGSYQLFYLKKEVLFWRYQVLFMMVVFLCYLPALCFSGLDALANNHYVAPMTRFNTYGDFAQWMFPRFEQYIIHMFSALELRGRALSVPLMFLPALLLFFRKRPVAQLLGVFVVSLWLSFFTIVILMKRLPFERNLTGHYSITMLAVIWVFFEGLRLLARRRNIVLLVTFPVVVLLFAKHFIKTESYFLKETLYEHDVNGIYTQLNKGMLFIPAGSTAAFSDEAFYCSYTI